MSKTIKPPKDRLQEILVKVQGQQAEILAALSGPKK
jgi:hypothetical protein